MNLMRTAGSGHIFDMRRWAKQKVWHIETYPEELNKANQDANAQTAMLGVRVNDEHVQTVLARLKSECSGVMGAKTREASHEGMNEAGALFVMLNEQIGHVLKQIDQG